MSASKEQLKGFWATVYRRRQAVVDVGRCWNCEHTFDAHITDEVLLQLLKSKGCAHQVLIGDGNVETCQCPFSPEQACVVA